VSDGTFREMLDRLIRPPLFWTVDLFGRLKVTDPFAPLRYARMAEAALAGNPKLAVLMKTVYKECADYEDMPGHEGRCVNCDGQFVGHKGWRETVLLKVETTMGSDKKHVGWAVRWGSTSNGHLYYVQTPLWTVDINAATTFTTQAALLHHVACAAKPSCWTGAQACYEIGKIVVVTTPAPDEYVVGLDAGFAAGGVSVSSPDVALRFATPAQAWAYAKDAYLTPPVLGSQTLHVHAVPSCRLPQTTRVFEPCA
jgi:hypothetical protein